jgi:hypothetical protein
MRRASGTTHSSMARKATVVIEKDDHGFYAWCPELKGCQSQGNTLEETVANIKEAIEQATQSVRCWTRASAICAQRAVTASLAEAFRVTVPFHGSAVLHPKMTQSSPILLTVWPPHPN